MSSFLKLKTTPFVVAGVMIAAGSPAPAVPYLNADTVASVCGGGSCGHFDNQSLSPANASNSLHSQESDTLADGSYAHASSTAMFGELHAYADGDRKLSPTQDFGNSQARGFAEFNDIFTGAGGQYNLTFNVSGSHTLVDGLISIVAGSDLLYQVLDLNTNYSLASGTWYSTDAAQTTNFVASFIDPNADNFALRVYFEASTYTSNNSPAIGRPGYGEYPLVSDYGHTLHVTADNAAGPVVGLSGHDYSAVPTSDAPEPKTWALMAVAFGAVGIQLRRNRSRTIRSAPGST